MTVFIIRVNMWIVKPFYCISVIVVLVGNGFAWDTYNVQDLFLMPSARLDDSDSRPTLDDVAIPKPNE